uniref:THAP-type domain-containing protein n=1 Tax=Phlebotomus kandelakii TaxID=1109342 RepID=A0A6B2E9E7_9DIPT
MRNCFVPFCDLQCKTMEKRMMFLPPKDEETFEKWKANLPKKRPFKRNDRVCERHFNPEDVIKTWEHVINGQVFHLERGKPRLRPSAVPCLNFPNDDEIRERKTRKRTSNEASPGKESKRQRREVEVLEEELSPVTRTMRMKQEDTEIILETIVQDEEQRKSVFASLFEEIYEIILPSLLWGIHRDPNHEFFAFTCFDGRRLCASKVVHVDSDLTMSVHVKGALVSSDQLDYSSINTDYLSAILSEIDDQIICQGDDEKCKVYPEENSDFCDNCYSGEVDN